MKYYTFDKYNILNLNFWKVIIDNFNDEIKLSDIY